MVKEIFLSGFRSSNFGSWNKLKSRVSTLGSFSSTRLCLTGIVMVFNRLNNVADHLLQRFVLANCSGWFWFVSRISSPSSHSINRCATVLSLNLHSFAKCKCS